MREEMCSQNLTIQSVSHELPFSLVMANSLCCCAVDPGRETHHPRNPPRTSLLLVKALHVNEQVSEEHRQQELSGESHQREVEPRGAGSIMSEDNVPLLRSNWAALHSKEATCWG